jgi:hypothetical protein
MAESASSNGSSTSLPSNPPQQSSPRFSLGLIKPAISRPPSYLQDLQLQFSEKYNNSVAAPLNSALFSARKTLAFYRSNYPNALLLSSATTAFILSKVSGCGRFAAARNSLFTAAAAALIIYPSKVTSAAILATTEPNYRAAAPIVGITAASANKSTTNNNASNKPN